MLLSRRTSAAITITLIAAVAVGATRSIANPARIGEVVRPILSDNCYSCHGPDEQSREAGVRLDIPGEVDLEEVLQRIESEDEGYRMPPRESHKSLSDAEIDAIKQWIDLGAPYEQHWSFRPLAEPEVPAAGAGWSDRPIDRFVAARHEERGLAPSPRADRRTLLRRLALDLTGLPPTPEEVKGFLADGSERAYPRLVDRLLAKAEYGEHMARYWLDLIRYADTNGLHHDHYRQMTPFRDWVIRSFNDNLPYDEFASWQLAGDLYEQPSSDQLVASGFNRLHLIIDKGTALPEESFHRNVVDRVSAVGTAFLGLSLECAVCHDHKYDPITQKDFYRLYAFFNNFDGRPETGGRRGLDFERGLQKPYLELPTPEQQRNIDRLSTEIEQATAQLEAVRGSVASPVSLADANGVAESDQEQAEDQDQGDPTDEIESRLNELKQELDEVRREVPATLVMKERSEPRETHLLIRGAYDQPGEEVDRGTPEFLPPLQRGEGAASRRDLADWLVDDEHPLTARVAVNRFWQQFFGVGLSKTSEDLGAQGEPPTHPRLLDYLAGRFVALGWDVKALVREIVLSETYRQSSRAGAAAYAADSENRWLARGSRFRLDAEVIRDQALAVSGLLSREKFGPSIRPPQPSGVWASVTMPDSYPSVYQQDTGTEVWRRSVYVFWKRAMPPPQMTIFDAPTRESCRARRERTNTPLQALVLMNEPQQLEAARQIARGLLSESADDETRLRAAYERIAIREPSDTTVAALVQSLGAFRSLYDRTPDAASRLAGESAGGDAVEHAAWTMVAHSLLNLDETRVRP